MALLVTLPVLGAEPVCYTDKVFGRWGTCEDDDEASDGIAVVKQDFSHGAKLCVTTYPDGKRSFTATYKNKDSYPENIESPPMPSVKSKFPGDNVWEVRIGKTTRYRFQATSGPKGLAMQACKYNLEQHKWQCVLTLVPPG